MSPQRNRIATGLDAIDRITRGLSAGHLVVISSRPDQGKTALLLTIAANTAFRQARAVGILSLEARALVVANRIVAAEARVPLRQLASGRLHSGPGGQACSDPHATPADTSLHRALAAG